MKNTPLLPQPVALSDVEKILMKRFGGEYRGITSNDPVDFALGCEMRYLLEQLHPLLPSRFLLDLYEHQGKPAGGLQRVLRHAVSRVGNYGDLLLLLNILGITFGHTHSPDVKRQYVEGTLAGLREEIDLMLIEQRVLEICLQQFRQAHGPDVSTVPHAALLHLASQHFQRSRFKAALYLLLDLIAHRNPGQ